MKNNSMPEIINSEILKAVVKEQIIQIADPIVKSAFEKIVIEPVPHLRKWDYGTNNEEFECWTIAIDEPSNTSIIYSAFGFGPEMPWGLVSSSTNYFGMDSGWFTNLKDCFLDSFMAAELPIWCVEKKAVENDNKIIGENLTLDEAFELIKALNLNGKGHAIKVRKYNVAP
jgi:hypothetical protein